MKEDDSGSSPQRVRTQQSPAESPVGDTAAPAKPTAASSVLEQVDWEKVRTTAYRITAQVKAVKEVEQTVRKQLQGLYDTECQGGRDCQDLALGITQSAAAEWLLKHLDWQELQAYMYALTRRVGSTDEITQSVRDKLLRMTTTQWDEVTDRKKYLDGIVFNTAMDWNQREESQQYAAVRQLQQAQLPEHDPGDVAARACALCDAATLLNKLGPRVRQAFVFRQVWGYTVKEIALRMSIGEETVKTYLSKAAEVFSDLEECRESRRPGRRLTRWFTRKGEQP